MLGLLFTNPERSFYTNEIVKRAGMGMGTAQRNLEKLSRTRILTVKKIGRAVNPAIYRPTEFRKRTDADSGFIKRIIEQPKTFLIGTEDDIRKH